MSGSCFRRSARASMILCVKLAGMNINALTLSAGSQQNYFFPIPGLPHQKKFRKIPETPKVSTRSSSGHTNYFFPGKFFRTHNYNPKTFSKIYTEKIFLGVRKNLIPQPHIYRRITRSKQLLIPSPLHFSNPDPLQPRFPKFPKQSPKQTPIGIHQPPVLSKTPGGIV